MLVADPMRPKDLVMLCHTAFHNLNEHTESKNAWLIVESN